MVATFLLLAAGNVLALGLGQIEVKSRINQPLLAEIPIISTTPGELEALQVRLASPETFRRVGLSPPQGAAANLQFSLGNDARGRPVIRVTTTEPVNQAVLNFLIEVDWGQGRLVREYSALIDAPRTASAPLQPAITAPVVATPNTVQRPAVAPAPIATEALPATSQPVLPTPTAVVAASPPRPFTAEPSAPAAQVPIPQSMPAAEPTPPPAAIAPTPRPSAVPPVATAVAPVVSPPPPVVPPPMQTRYGPVKVGETLSKIASVLDQAGAYTLDQTMLALLRANPDAFLDDNVNLLKQGAVLRVPGRDDRASISADEAQLVVRQQMQQWRQARRAVTQPDTPVAGDVRTRDAAASAVQAQASKPATRQAPASSQAQARLEIVPASAPGKATGTRSGTTVGGEGSMLQQQLRQRDEDLAARAAEIGELKERVAELENLKQQQDQLLTLKDSELAAAQQRLADARTAASTPAASVATTPAAQAAQATQPVPEPQTVTPTMLPWLWGSLAVLGLGLLAWLLMHRSRSPITPAPRRGFDSAAMAATLRNPAGDAPASDASGQATSDAHGATAAVEEHIVEEHIVEASIVEEQTIDIADIPTTPPPRQETPTWHSGRWLKSEPEPQAPVSAAPRFVPPEDAPAVLETATPLMANLQPPSAEQRLRLARAFLDIGDEHSATQLLRELVVDPDPAARAEAAKLLRELD